MSSKLNKSYGDIPTTTATTKDEARDIYNQKNIQYFRIPNDTSPPMPQSKKPVLTSPRRVTKTMHSQTKQSTSSSIQAKKSNDALSKPTNRRLTYPETETHHLSTKPMSAQELSRDEQRRMRSWDRLTSLLRRAIDDVYVECEAESLMLESKESCETSSGYKEMCQEILEILQRGVKDFIELQERELVLNSQDTNVAWAVRPTSSPNPASPFDERSMNSDKDDSIQVQQDLDNIKVLFGENSPFATNGLSWADLSENSPEQPTSTTVMRSGKSPQNAWGLHSPPRTNQPYQVHQMLSSPSRIKPKTAQDIKDKQEHKLAKAEWNRNSKHLQNQIKAKKDAEKIQQVTERKAEQIALIKEQTEEKLQRAQKNHSNILKKKSEDAKNENLKVEEIRFIQKLNNEDSKFQLNKKLVDSKLKRDKLLTERKEKIKEESVREAAAKKKREEIEMQRLLALESQLKLKKEKEERMQEEKRKKSVERQSKNVQYESKVQKTKETKMNELEQMKSDYEKKMEASAVRKSLNLESKREKAAAEVQKVKEATTRKSTDELLPRDVTYEMDESTKRAIKKRTKKIRHRLLGQKKKLDVLPIIATVDDNVKPRSMKLKKIVQELHGEIDEDLTKLSIETASSLKKNVDSRIIQDVKFLIRENIPHMIGKVIALPTIGSDVKQICIEILVELCNSSEVCTLITLSLDLIPLAELLSQKLCSSITVPEDSELQNLCIIISRCLSSEFVLKNKPIEDTIREELINFLVTLDVMEQMKENLLFFVNSKIPITRKVVELISLLSTVTSHSSRVGKLQKVYMKKEVIGCATLLKAIKDSNLVAIPPLLTWMLLRESGNVVRSFDSISPTDIQVVGYSLKMLNSIACLDLSFVQEALGETFQSELFHIALGIISYHSTLENDVNSVSQHNIDQVITDLILLLGFFTMEHPKNQEMLRYNNGNDMPLQKLCCLPIRFFTDSFLKSVLIPTLVSICDNNELNRHIMEHDLSTQLITSYFGSLLENSQPSTSTSTSQPTVSMYHPCFRFSEQKIKDCIQYFSIKTTP